MDLRKKITNFIQEMQNQLKFMGDLLEQEFCLNKESKELLDIIKADSNLILSSAGHMKDSGLLKLTGDRVKWFMKKFDKEKVEKQYDFSKIK